jgi:trk system potassium uptake protein TrkA
MKTYAVIGLGRFGFAVARGLMAPDPRTGRQQNEVLAIDVKETHIQDIADQVTRAVCADLRDPEVVKALNVAACDVVIVAIGSDISTSVLITLNLKEAGARCVIAKATNEQHRRILQKIGADDVIIPELDFGTRLAQSLSQSSAYDLVSLSDEYSIVRAPIPKSWQGKTLAELNVRAKYGINVLAIRSNGSANVNVSPSPNEALPVDGGTITMVVSQSAIQQLQKL